jgi:N6-L-threonylcarbamoyladenine synthase
MLKLDYPGGPAVSRLAENGDAGKFDFPRPMLDRPGLDFSFSGLKTSVLNALNNTENYLQKNADIAASFQAAAVDTLSRKCERALKETRVKRLVVAGGVSANKLLRAQLAAMAAKHKADVFYPALPFCTDNGAMIAFAGCQRLLQGEKQGMGISVKPRWPMMELRAPGA